MNTLNLRNDQVLTIVKHLSKFQGHKYVDYFNAMSIYFDSEHIYFSSSQPASKIFVKFKNDTDIINKEILFFDSKDLLKLIKNDQNDCIITFDTYKSEIIFNTSKDLFKYSVSCKDNDMTGIFYTYAGEMDCFNPDEIKSLKQHLCKDELREAMTGIFFDHNVKNEGSFLTAVATDAHTLCKIDTNIFIKSDTFIMPENIFSFFLGLKNPFIFYYYNKKQ
jgi:hypothetical protein